MQRKLDESSPPPVPRGRAIVPSVSPFAAPAAVQVRSRSILIDAAACFVATSLGSLAPQAFDLLEPPRHVISANVDPASGKILDRVLIGGLQPFAGEEERVAPPPRFLAYPALASAAAANDAPSETHPAQARASSDRSATAARRSPEMRVADTVPTPETRPADVAAAPESARPAETAEQGGLLSALTPSGLSSKLAPVGQKVWSGAKSVAGVVAGGFSWFDD